jgi:hypothetical protein
VPLKSTPKTVTPAKAGAQLFKSDICGKLDPGLRRDDGQGVDF